MTGIYKITNTINGKCYIGQSIDIVRRWRQHRTDYQTEEKVLYQAMRKYGFENFSFEVLEECKATVLDERELFWINEYDSYNNGYNATLLASVSGHPVKLSEQQIDEIILDLKEMVLTQGQIAGKFNVGEDTISEINQGKTRLRIGIEYPIRKRQVKGKRDNQVEDSYCPQCGEIKNAASNLCMECFRKSQRAGRPSREELKDLIRTVSFVELGKQYGVSDNAIRKWCIAYNLPSKKKDIKSYTDEQWKQI